MRPTEHSDERPTYPVEAPSPAVPTPHKVAGRYVIESLLGRGGFGTVYDATDLLERRKVALKVIRRDGSGTTTGRSPGFAAPGTRARTWGLSCRGSPVTMAARWSSGSLRCRNKSPMGTVIHMQMRHSWLYLY